LSREVDRPTYEIVGELSRFDERDSVFARERLVPGSPEEIAYHKTHPESAAIDRRLAAFIHSVDQPEESSSPIDAALYRSAFDPAPGLALPDIVDGEVAPTRVEADPGEMALRIKALACHLGADEVRVGPLNPAWVYSHRGTPPFFADYQPNLPHFGGMPEGYNGCCWGDPIELSHKYAISMAFGQDLGLLRTGGTPLSDLEVGRAYSFSALVAAQVAAYIRALGWPARAHHVRSYGVALVPVAVDAGLGELGRCGYLINRRLGANLRLACVTTDLPLAVDRPVDMGIQDFCRKCLKCATTCPPKAIPSGDPVVVRGVRKWKINPEQCLLYWGYLGSGCTICQTVCPWSKPPTWPHRIVSRIAISLPFARRLLVWADDLVYGRDFIARPHRGRFRLWREQARERAPGSTPEA
jgi:reductive dehalogenase